MPSLPGMVHEPSLAQGKCRTPGSQRSKVREREGDLISQHSVDSPCSGRWESARKWGQVEDRSRPKDKPSQRRNGDGESAREEIWEWSD